MKTGEEKLRMSTGLSSFRLLDFWRWDGSDLLNNTKRGAFAEFVVATATGCDITKPREAWSKFDLETPDGIKLEVKSAAYLQSWNQPTGRSRIMFSIKEALPWDAGTNRQGTKKERSADVYVFCLLHHADKRTVDPLDLDQWTFFVRSVRELERYTRSRHSITLKSLEGIADRTHYKQLANAIIEAHARP